MYGNNDLVAVPGGETKLLFTAKTEELGKEIGCIGYVRADFSSTGDEFWSTWWDKCPELKSQAFKDEIGVVVNSLRKDGILKNRSAMSAYCSKNQKAQLANEPGYVYGFKLTTDKHVYYLRCDPTPNNYNLYCYAYDRGRLEKFLSPPEKQNEGKKPSLTGRLQEKKAEVDARNAERKSNAAKKGAPEV